MTLKDIYSKEHSMLRDELHELKDCQLRYFTLSVTATGALLTIAFNLVSGDLFLGTAYLLPLTILIPSWWIFFDKATTITRIVGYYRNLEKLILETHSANFVGWENSLEIFRVDQQKGRLKIKSTEGEGSLIISLFRLMLLQTPHRYWMLVHYTFSGLAALCLILSYDQWENSIYLYIATAIVITSAIWNVVLIWQLVWGRYSYTANEEFWVEILHISNSNEDEK